MTDEDSVRLGELHTAFTIFIKEWDIVKDRGFGLCAGRLAELESLKKEVSWIRNTFLTIVIATTITFIINGTLKESQSQAAHSDRPNIEVKAEQ